MKGVRLPLSGGGIFSGQVETYDGHGYFRFMDIRRQNHRQGWQGFTNRRKRRFIIGEATRKPRQAYLVSIAAWIL